MRPTFIYQTLKFKFKLRGLKLINLSRVSQYKCLFRNTQTTPQFTYLDQCPSIRPQVSGPFFCHLHAKPLTSYQFTSIDTTSQISFSPHKWHNTHVSAGYTWRRNKIKGRWKSKRLSFIQPNISIMQDKYYFSNSMHSLQVPLLQYGLWAHPWSTTPTSTHLSIIKINTDI